MKLKLIFCVAWFVTVGSLFGQNASVNTLSLTDGVLIDRESGRLYVMTPEHRLAAVNMTTGEIVWQRDVSGKPLFIQNGLLVVYRENDSVNDAASIVMFDKNNGEFQPNRAFPMALPMDAHKYIDDGLGKQFRIHPILEDQAVALVWQSRRKTPSPVPPEMTGLTPFTAEGAVGFDQNLSALVPVSRALSFRESAHLTVAPGASALPNQVGPRYASVDRNAHISVQRNGSEPNIFKYQWRVLDAEGNLLGSFQAETGGAPFVVRDQQLIYAAPGFIARQGENMVQTPYRLRAVNLQTGEEMWTLPLRDTKYYGPYPP